MNKKLMMVALLLGGLTLGACVDDNESASVTAVRNAKAEQLAALAQKAKAEAEAALITANANAEREKAYAEYYKAQAEEKAFDTQKAKEKYERTLEKIKLKEEAELWTQKKLAAEAELEFLQLANEQTATLYADYNTALNSYNTALNNVKFYTQRVASLKSNHDATVEWREQQIAYWTMQIERQKADIEYYKAYEGYDTYELQKELANAQAASAKSIVVVQQALDAKAEANDALDEIYDTRFGSTESDLAIVKSAAAFVDAYYEAYWDYAMADWSAATPVDGASAKINPERIIKAETKTIASFKDEYGVLNDVDVEVLSLNENYANLYLDRALTGAEKTAQDNLDAALEALGKEAVGTEAATGAYKTYADAKKADDEANKALKDAEAEKKAAGTDAAKIAAAQAKIDAANLKINGDPSATPATPAYLGTKVVLTQAEDALAQAKDDVAAKEATLEKAKELPALYAAMVAAFNDADAVAAYEKAIEELKEGEAKTYVEAYEAWVEATDASTEANALVVAITALVANGIDVEVLIYDAEIKIADYQADIVEYQNLNSYNEDLILAENQLKYWSAQVDALKAIADLKKKALDDYLASLGGGDSEE